MSLLPLLSKVTDKVQTFSDYNNMLFKCQFVLRSNYSADSCLSLLSSHMLRRRETEN